MPERLQNDLKNPRGNGCQRTKRTGLFKFVVIDVGKDVGWEIRIERAMKVCKFVYLVQFFCLRQGGWE